MIDVHHFKNLLSTYRGYLMGISILWIMFHHIGFFGLYDFGGFADFIIKLGSCGVDVFLVLSSFGLYKSLSHNSSLTRFYKRRIIRIIPPFVIIVSSFRIKHLIDLFSFSFWKYELLYNNWFISFILIAYILFPFIYKIQKKYLWLPFVLSCVISLVGTVLLITYNMDDIHQIPMLMVQRMPVFCMGSLVADNRFRLPVKHVFLLLFAILFAIYLSFSMKVEYLIYPLYLFLMIPLLYCLSSLMEKTVMDKTFLANTHMLVGWVNYCGAITLEIYLVHMKIIPILVHHKMDGLFGVLIVFASSILLASIFHRVLNISSNRLKTTFINKKL